MPWTGPLTTDDLDEIGGSFREQPFEVAAELVDAVNRGLVADEADTGYALSWLPTNLPRWRFTGRRGVGRAGHPGVPSI
jgi:hypothetical protein